MTERFKIITTNPNNPQTPFEVEMMEAAHHALQHLTEGYALAMECGLNSSRAKSQGVILACTQLLANHIMQHCANQLVGPELIVKEIDNVSINLKSIFDESYPEHLAEMLAYASQKETKQ